MGDPQAPLPDSASRRLAALRYRPILSESGLGLGVRRRRRRRGGATVTAVTWPVLPRSLSRKGTEPVRTDPPRDQERDRALL